MSFLEQNGWNAFQQYIWPIISAVLIAIIVAAVWFCRDQIKKFIFSKKVQKIYNPIVAAYEEKVLPEYVEKIPKIRVVLKEDEIPPPDQTPFGYIFIPAKKEEVITNILIANTPMSSSLKDISLCFEETLRKNLYRYLAYRLAIEVDKQEVATKIRDYSLREEREAKDFEVIEKLYVDGKLTNVLLNEARLRLRRTSGHPTISDMKEFSTLARKLAEIEVEVVRVGMEPREDLIEQCRRLGKNIVLFARGGYGQKAKEIANELCTKIDKVRGMGFELTDEKNLGFPNPESGTWYFTRRYHKKPEEVPFMRIWLRRVEYVQVTESVWERKDREQRRLQV